MLLQFSASVGGFAFLVEAAFVADGDGAVVVAYGMNALNALGQDGDDCAIALDVIVVRGLTETLLTGVDEAVDSEVLVASARGAVQYQILHIFRS